MQGIVTGVQSSNATLDAIIDNYVVSSDGNLNAGDLCEFINGQIRKTSCSITSTSVKSSYLSTGNTFSASVIDSSRVLISYMDGSSYVRAVVITISNGVITLGTSITVNGSASGWIKCIVLSTTQAIVTYSLSSNGYGYSTALTISSSTLTSGASTQIGSTVFSLASLLVLNSTQALVAYSSNSDYAYCAILTASGTTVTVTGVTALNGGTIASSATSLVLLNSTQVLMTFANYTNNQYLSAVVLTINGSTITSGTVYQITNIPATYVSSCLMSANTILVSYSYTNSSNLSYLGAVILTVNGNSVTKGNSCVFNIIATYPYSNILLIMLNSTHALLTYMGPDNFCYGIILILGNDIVSSGTVYQFNSVTSTGVSTVILSPTQILVSYISGGLNSVVMGIDTNCNISNTIQTHTKQPYVIAMQSGNSGNVIKGILKGIVTGLSGLTPQSTYYCDDSGNLTTTQTRAGEKAVGVALSTTDLLINKGFWER
jgi:hypothetical protein